MVRAAQRKQQRSRKQTAHYGASVPRDPPVRPSLSLFQMRGPKKFDIDQLVKDVMQAFQDYPAEELERMWQHKTYVMGAVLDTKPKKGGSNYPRHDPAKRRL